MKFRRSTRTGCESSAAAAKPINLKTIEKKKPQQLKKKSVNFKFFELEGKENKRRPKELPEDDVLSERLAHGLSLFKEAKPIPKPVLSHFMGPQNYFKRSFSMRAPRSTTTAIQPTPLLNGSTENIGEQKTATIRRAFGKSLTSKDTRISFHFES